MINDREAKIAKLNDSLRATFSGGSIHLTIGVQNLAEAIKNEIVTAVRSFSAFTADNDPFGEHDCASLQAAGYDIIFKIDYYDPTLTYYSDDPTDPGHTHRVLTIMLAGEY